MHIPIFEICRVGLYSSLSLLLIVTLFGHMVILKCMVSNTSDKHAECIFCDQSEILSLRVWADVTAVSAHSVIFLVTGIRIVPQVDVLLHVGVLARLLASLTFSFCLITIYHFGVNTHQLLKNANPFGPCVEQAMKSTLKPKV